MRTGASLSWTRIVLVVVLAVELALIGSSLWMLEGAEYAWVAPLEARALARSANVVVRAPDVLDAVSVFCGSPVLGRDPIAESGAKPASFRSQLVFDPGHFSWVMLRDKGSAADPLRALAVRGLTVGSSARRKVEAGLDDGVVNVFYDLGGDERTWLHNWSTVGVQEMQMSPLLPWAKRLDVIVLSTYDPEHCAGLSHILRNSPDVLVVGPPLPARLDARWGDEGPTLLATLRRVRRLVPFPPGLHRLTSRLALLVYPTDRGACEAALVLTSGTRAAIVCGAGGRTAVELVEAAERAGAGPITAFVGATGYELEDARLPVQAQRLLATHPQFRLAVGFGASLDGLALLTEAFGVDRVQAARLGARLRLEDL